VTSGRTKTAVLISGRGSNLVALLDAASEPDFPAEITLAISSRADAGGLEKAREFGVPTRVVDHRAYPARAEFDNAISALLVEAGIGLVCLAGFMRILSANFVEAWRDRMINIHPSLLPALPGLETHRRAIDAGMERHGASVHFVRPEMDSGPVIVQGTVPVLPGDTPDRLAARVLTVEHRIYPLALRLVADGSVRVVGEHVIVPAGVRTDDPGLIWPD